jgi:toxin ParE1/3/4
LSLRVVWSSDADSDLEEIWNYLAQQASVARADNQVHKILAACRKLSDWPFPGQARDSLILGMRSVVSAPYVIFYRVRSDTVEIVRVLHGRRDIEAVFTAEP